eukprot:Hpha_TRINITY_DN15616_c3_g2::TRINITY_DN15616_c3_g2_i1::g.101654::m.101654
MTGLDVLECVVNLHPRGDDALRSVDRIPAHPVGEHLFTDAHPVVLSHRRKSVCHRCIRPLRLGAHQPLGHANARVRSGDGVRNVPRCPSDHHSVRSLCDETVDVATAVHLDDVAMLESDVVRRLRRTHVGNVVVDGDVSRHSNTLENTEALVVGLLGVEELAPLRYDFVTLDAKLKDGSPGNAALHSTGECRLHQPPSMSVLFEYVRGLDALLGVLVLRELVLVIALRPVRFPGRPGGLHVDLGHAPLALLCHLLFLRGEPRAAPRPRQTPTHFRNLSFKARESGPFSCPVSWQKSTETV